MNSESETDISRERYTEIEQLYHEVRQHGPDEHAAFLEQACADDESLRHEVEALLAEDAGSSGCCSQGGRFKTEKRRDNHSKI